MAFPLRPGIAAWLRARVEEHVPPSGTEAALKGTHPSPGQCGGGVPANPLAFVAQPVSHPTTLGL